jgi:general stress protein YciG
MTKPRGFAAMSQEQRRIIATKGGKAVKAEDRGFARDRAFAAEAGRKGGLSPKNKTRTFSVDKPSAAEAGRKGGLATQRKARERRANATQEANHEDPR